jgi:S1-C subfamily serine protease
MRRIALGVLIFGLVASTAYAADFMDRLPTKPPETSQQPSFPVVVPIDPPPPLKSLGTLQPGRGIADGIVMPTDISQTKLEAAEIYKENLFSVMLLLVTWNAPVTKEDIPELSDEEPGDGSPSLKQKAIDSLKEEHPIILRHKSTGSGVAIFKAKATTQNPATTYYLTNCHVLDITTIIPPQVFFNYDLSLYHTSHTIKIQNHFQREINNGDMEAELIEARPDIDICVIAYRDTGSWLLNGGNPISGIRTYEDLKVGEKVYAIGNPVPGTEETLTWSLTDGLISGLRDDETIQISAIITHGNSGGGLFDERGNLIGITSSGYEKTQGYNFAIAADKIWRRYGK